MIPGSDGRRLGTATVTKFRMRPPVRTQMAARDSRNSSVVLLLAAHLQRATVSLCSRKSGPWTRDSM